MEEDKWVFGTNFLPLVAIPDQFGNPSKHCFYGLKSRNFLLRNSPFSDQFDPRIDLIGHLEEFPHVLGLINFTYDPTIEDGRVSSQNVMKTKYFPRRIDWLSNETLQDLCQFLQLDYYMLDFEPPDACYSVLPNLTTFQVR